jgi:hypothetical protein
MISYTVAPQTAAFTTTTVDGTPSSFLTVTAAGGKGGVAVAATNAHIGGAGGAGGSGTFNGGTGGSGVGYAGDNTNTQPGGGGGAGSNGNGGDGLPFSNDPNQSTFGPGGDPSATSIGGGNGGNGAASSGNNGLIGNAPGGGGSGAYAATSTTQRSGGAGARGQIRITYTAFPFPVELTYFKGKSIDEGIQLDWQTASEVDNDHFIVERSQDGVYFESRGKVNGKGTVDFTHNYSFLDERPTSGNNYYRLRQVDIDGTFDLSVIVVVNHALSGEININYLPHAEVLRINGSSTYNSVQIVDMMGRNIKMISALKSGEEVPVNDLPQGTYRVIVRTKEGISKSANIVKY